jgi:hypothetical protein
VLLSEGINESAEDARGSLPVVHGCWYGEAATES